MRSRERLIEVLATVNIEKIGQNAHWLKQAGRLLAGETKNIEPKDYLKRRMQLLADPTSECSAHIRDLAAEALHYLQEDANG